MNTLKVIDLDLNVTHTMYMEIKNGKSLGLVKSTEGHIPTVKSVTFASGDEKLVVSGNATLIDLESEFFDGKEDQVFSMDLVEFLPTDVKRVSDSETLRVSVSLDIYDEQGNCFEDASGEACIQLAEGFTGKFFDLINQSKTLLHV